MIAELRASHPVTMLLAKSRRMAGARGSGPDEGQPGRARGGAGPLGEPGGEPGDVQRSGGHEVLEAGFRQAAVARVAQIERGDALGDRPFHPGTGGVARREVGFPLACPRGDQGQVPRLRVEREPPRPARRARAVGAAGADAAGRGVEADDDVGVAVRVVGRRPLLARVALGAGDVAGIPVGTVTLSFD